MNKPELHLFDQPYMIVNNRIEDLPLIRPTFLLVYLALQNTWVSRDELMGIFWPEHEASAAQRNLRVCLLRARNLAKVGQLQTEYRRVRYDVQTDVQVFKDALANNQTELALGLYKHDLFNGYACVNPAPFCEWLAGVRTNLQQQWHAAMLAEAQSLEKNANPQRALRLLEKLVQHDDLNEEHIRHYAHSLAKLGKREQAVRQIETFRERVWTGLQLQLSVETENTLAKIRGGENL